MRGTDSGATWGAYAYDGMGRRVESVETTTTLYAYAGTETLMEMVPGVGVNDYVYAAGLRIAKVSGAVISYYHEDALGSTRLVTDASKRLLFSDNYQPFGQDQSTGAETYRFTGKPVSQTTGLYYYYHRWYDPSIGRFISPDPKPCPLSECQKLNRYVYVTNRPTTLTDPDGEGTIMCQTSDGMISACGILRDSSGNLPPGTRILGSSAQPTVSSTSPGTTTMPDSSTEVTAPTGILRDNFGNLPAGTRITVVRTPTGSVVMGTTTVGAIDQQIEQDRARIRTAPSINYDALNAYNQCVQTATQFIDAGAPMVAVSGTVSLIGAALIEIPPAAAVVEGISIGLVVVGLALILTSAIYYGVNCHYPS